ncbi:TPM domain-containing protein [Lederbergia citri]|uniref:TPM domain-containing protein n=1 Tax=Lederbergia citri TaxID=2833580 RepID=A0A942THL9_9BACI|nr:TPM domain-containing protein [Lederbergia citri]MBS4197800.1 TPM domain-containing protein [Lederbergia citri]
MVKKYLFIITFFLILLPFSTNSHAAEQKIYDYAGLLTDDQVQRLEAMANEYGAKRNSDFIILTTNDTEGKTAQKYMEDFYDETAPGYDKPHGNTAILTIDINGRNVYLGGFYKAEKYLDDERLTQIREKITPDLSNGNYEHAFETFIKTSYKYMGFRPGVNPDNLFFNIWFQIICSLGLAGIIVGIMAYNSGGRVTINSSTYEDGHKSRVLDRRDIYIRTTTTKRRKPSNNSSGGGSRGGGGFTSGGHSHSGSGGKF